MGKTGASANENMKCVYLIGSFMNDNFGDYLLYHETIKAINDEYSGKVKIVVSGVSDFYDKYDEVNRLSHKEALKAADCVLMTGGGYFGEGDRHKLLWDLFFVKYFGLKALSVAKSKKPYAIIGVGVGPFKYYFARKITRTVFNGANVISVRDAESKAFLEKLKVKKHIDVHADWILGMDNADLIKQRPIVKDKYFRNYAGKILLVHIISKNTANSNLAAVTADLKFFLNENAEYKAVVTCDQSKKDVFERTKKIAEELKPWLLFYYEYKSPWELSSIISYADMVVTDKLHVGVAATNLGKTVVSVPLHSKTPRFYKQIDRAEICIPMKNVVSGQVKSLMDKAKEIQLPDTEKYKKDSQVNRTLVKEFLKWK